MRKTIGWYEFMDSMMSYYGGNGFTYEGLSALFDYLEELEHETGEELEFDAAALHRQYSEMSVSDFINDYYDADDIEAILSANRLYSVDEITADVIQEYEWSSKNDRAVAKVNDNTIIVDTKK